MYLYADCNSGVPLRQEVKDKMCFLLKQEFGNSSQILSPLGKKSSLILEQARAEIANFVGCDFEELVFTSGGTESCLMAILGATLSRGSRNTIITSNIEHAAVQEACNAAATLANIKINKAEANKTSLVSKEEIISKTDNDTFLISLMAANNETGVCQPWKEISKNKDLLFHSDMTQWIGKKPFNFKESNLDLVSFSAHKLGGPQGVGALIVKKGCKWKSPMIGGGQELGKRGGTEAVCLIAGFAQAVSFWRNGEVEKTRDYFESKINFRIIGKEEKRLPNTSFFVVDDVASNELVSALVNKNIIVASGSACSKGAGSKVLEALGYSERESKSAIRVSFLEDAKIEQAQELADNLNNEVERIRSKNKAELKSLYER